MHCCPHFRGEQVFKMANVSDLFYPITMLMAPVHNSTADASLYQFFANSKENYCKAMELTKEAETLIHIYVKRQRETKIQMKRTISFKH